MDGYITNFIKEIINQQLTFEHFKDYLSDNLLCLNEEECKYLTDFYLYRYFPIFSSLLLEFEEEIFKGKLILKEGGKVVYIKLLKYSQLSFVRQIHERIVNILYDNGYDSSDVNWNDDNFLFSIVLKPLSYVIDKHSEVSYNNTEKGLREKLMKKNK